MRIGGQELGYGIRLLFKNPSFTLAAVLAMALGIATSTMIFSMVNAVLLRPLPYTNPDEVMIVWARFEARDAKDVWLSPPEVKDFRQQGTLFKDFAALADLTLNMTGNGDPEQLQVVGASGNLFSMLGVNMAKGRGFLPEEDQQGARKVAVLTHGFWQRRFGANEGILNQSLTLEGEPYVIVGVLPANFTIPPPSSVFPGRIDVFVPFDSVVPTAGTTNRDLRHVHVLTRTKPGVTPEQAQSQMNTIAQTLQQQYADAYPQDSRFRLSVVPFHNYIVKPIRPSLLILFIASILVLLIACVNIANLLLARAAAREKEFGIRVSLGAGPLMIVRQLLTESLLLAAAGGLLGVVLAFIGLRVLLKLSPAQVPLLQESRIDAWTLLFTVVVVILSAVAFGLTPAWHATRFNLSRLLNNSSKSVSTGRGRHRFSAGLVIGQIAVLLVLLIGVGLLIKSFLNLQREQLGFIPANALTMHLQLSPSYYREPADRLAFLQRIEKQLETLPGVQGVGAVTQLPLSGALLGSGFTPVDDSPMRDHPPESTDLRGVTPGYFKGLGIPLVEGRTFNDSDTADAPRRAVIDQLLARRFWPNQSAIGKRIKWIRSEEPLEVIGVVGSVKHVALDQPERPTTYFPLTQYARSQSVFFAIRTNADPSSLAGAVRNQIWTLDRNQPLADVQPMEDIVWKSIARQRLNLFLLSVFAGVALVLAAVGIYGMMSYAVTQRNREIGIRLALGAQQQSIFRLILTRALSLAAIGIAAGLLLSFVLTRLMSSILFGVSTIDPVIFGILSLFLMGVIVIASFVPARRATKVDPLVSLRNE
jgi:predicted permease